MRGRELSRSNWRLLENFVRNGMMFIQIHPFCWFLMPFQICYCIMFAFSLKNKKQSLSSLSVQPNMNGTSSFFVKESWVDWWLFSCFYRSARRFARILCIRLLHATLLTRKLAFMKQWTNRGSPGRATALTNNWSISSLCKVQKQVLHWHAQWDTWQCVGVSQLRFLKAVFSLIFWLLISFDGIFSGFMWHYHVSSCGVLWHHKAFLMLYGETRCISGWLVIGHQELHSS